MAMDITMTLLSKHGRTKAKNLFEGRNSEWFNLLRGHSFDDSNIYSYFPVKWGIPEKCSPEIQRDYDEQKEIGYFDFRYMTVRDFYTWVERYCPEEKAGWVYRYDEWLYRRKNIIPEHHYRYLGDEENSLSSRDYIWLEWVDQSDLTYQLYVKLNAINAEPDDVIVFYFDC